MRKKYWLVLSCCVATSVAACGDDEDDLDLGTSGAGGSSVAGSAGKNTAGNSTAGSGGGGAANGGTPNGGTPNGGGGSAGTPNGGGGTAGTDSGGMVGMAGEAMGGEASGGMAGAGGTSDGGASDGGSSLGGATAEPSLLCERDLWKYTFQFCPHGFEGSDNQPTRAVDGDTATYVTSGAAQDGTHYALFDLHGNVNVETLTLDYGDGAKAADAAAMLKVQGSNDGVTFTDLTGAVSGALVNNKLSIPFAAGATTRFIKLLQVGSSGSWWAIPELDIGCGAGTQIAPSADAGTATNRAQWKLSTPNSLCPATGPVGNMVDADAVDSAWQSVGRPGIGYWIHVDLGTTAALKGVHLVHKGTDFPPTLKVQVSTDDVTFEDAKSAVAGAQDLDVVFAETKNARFIRIVSEADTAGNWWTVADLNIDL